MGAQQGRWYTLATEEEGNALKLIDTNFEGDVDLSSNKWVTELHREREFDALFLQEEYRDELESL